MKKQIKDVIMEYQKIIAKLDNKLAMYEQLGTPEEISEKIKVVLKPIPESVMNEMVVQKSSELLESARARIEQEKKEEEFKVELSKTISIIPEQSTGDLDSIKELLSKVGV